MCVHTFGPQQVKKKFQQSLVRELVRVRVRKPYHTWSVTFTHHAIMRQRTETGKQYQSERIYLRNVLSRGTKEAARSVHFQPWREGGLLVWGEEKTTSIFHLLSTCCVAFRVCIAFLYCFSALKRKRRDHVLLFFSPVLCPYLSVCGCAARKRFTMISPARTSNGFSSTLLTLLRSFLSFLSLIRQAKQWRVQGR